MPSGSGRLMPPAPSEEIPQPRITATTRQPRRAASDSRISTTKPHPSPGRKPAERASNTRISSGAKAPAREKPTSSKGSSDRSTPPARATSRSPAASAEQALATASSEEAQAPSSV